MSGDLDGFAEWRDDIESRVSTLEVTVNTEKRARASMDRDMSDLGVKLDAQGRLLRAVAETQSDHTLRLTRLEVRAERLEVRAERLEAGQKKLEAGLAKVHAGVQTIIGLLDGQDSLPE